MASSIDEIIELYKKDVDRTLIVENLKLTPEQRVLRAQEMCEAAEELRRAGEAVRRKARENRSGTPRAE
jgi:hypothetical protein